MTLISEDATQIRRLRCSCRLGLRSRRIDGDPTYGQILSYRCGETARDTAVPMPRWLQVSVAQTAPGRGCWRRRHGRSVGRSSSSMARSVLRCSDIDLLFCRGREGGTWYCCGRLLICSSPSSSGKSGVVLDQAFVADFTVNTHLDGANVYIRRCPWVVNDLETCSFFLLESSFHRAGMILMKILWSTGTSRITSPDSVGHISLVRGLVGVDGG